MIRLLLAVCLFAALALSAACGDDDDAGGATPTGAVTETPNGEPTGTPDNGDTPEPTADDKPDRTPGPEPTLPPPDETEAATPAAEGTPIDYIEQPAEFFQANYPGQSPTELPCLYNPATHVVDCSEHGRYAPNPPLTGQDISCGVLVLDDGAPIAVRCTSQVPLSTIYYEIPQ
jgi:hypothetical protein